MDQGKQKSLSRATEVLQEVLPNNASLRNITLLSLCLLRFK